MVGIVFFFVMLFHIDCLMVDVVCLYGLYCSIVFILSYCFNKDCIMFYCGLSVWFVLLYCFCFLKDYRLFYAVCVYGLYCYILLLCFVLFYCFHWFCFVDYLDCTLLLCGLCVWFVLFYCLLLFCIVFT